MDISDTGLLALGVGREAQVLKDAFTKPTEVTYLKHSLTSPATKISGGGGIVASTKALLSSISIDCVRFRPLEDILGIGHTHGITTIVVPGSGEPNFDTFESNPFMTLQQRRETEIQSLIHKLNYETIGIGENTIYCYLATYKYIYIYMNLYL